MSLKSQSISNRKKETTFDFDDKYLDKLENVTFQPIFIFGLHRSGTSILYKMLNETKYFNPITAYHIINYDQLLYNHLNNKEKSVKDELNTYFKEYGQIDRGIDELELSANFPEEYCFIFTERRYKPKITSANLPLFIELCKKIQFISQNNKPLLLKNPFDFSNFLFIKKVFPDAKFIFIHRNPINVLNSAIKYSNYIFKKKHSYTAVLSTSYKKLADNPLIFNLFRFLLYSTTFFRVIYWIKLIGRKSEYYLNNIDALNKESYISIRYEDLCNIPEKEMSKLKKFLNIKTKTKVDYKIYVKPRKTILLKECQILRSYLSKKLRKYISFFKYEL